MGKKARSTVKKTEKTRLAAQKKRLTPVPKTPSVLRRGQLGNQTLPSEVLASARRLVGKRNSFDANTFIRHILYVNDVAPKSRFSLTNWAASYGRSVRSRGQFRNKTQTPRPGDLVLFSNQSGKQISSAGVSLIGVVERVSKGQVHFIAPVGNVVRRGKGSLTLPAKQTDTKLPCRTQNAKTCPAGQLLIGTVRL